VANSRIWAGSGGGNVGISPWRDWERDLSMIGDIFKGTAAACRAWALT
jgi:hypothetical protein